MPTGAVRISLSLKRAKERGNSFQEKIDTINPEAKIPGLDKGRIILQNIAKGPQPSIFAASLISNKLGISVKGAHLHFESSVPHRVNN